MTLTVEQNPGPTPDWPRDAESGRLLCAPGQPMPKGAKGWWLHPNARNVGECYEGCCDDFECPDCGATWRVECPQ